MNNLKPEQLQAVDASTPATWDATRADLADLTSCGPDWNGEGALPAGPGLVDAAVRLLDVFEQLNPDYLPPDASLAPDGTVLLAWYLPDGYSTIVNVRVADHAEVIHRKPGMPPQFEDVPIPPCEQVRPWTGGEPVSLLDDGAYKLAA